MTGPHLSSKHCIRDGVALSLVVYCSCLLGLYEYNGGSILSDVQSSWNTSPGLYLAGTILVNLGSAAIVLYDLISGKSNAIVNTACSCLMIVGAACYAVAFTMDVETISGYEEAYYIGCLVFVSLKSFYLAALILSDSATPVAKVELKSTVSALTGLSMLYYWYYDFHASPQKPTETQYILIEVGWALVTLFSGGMLTEYCGVDCSMLPFNSSVSRIFVSLMHVIKCPLNVT